MSVLISDENELDDEERCESRFGEDRCPNRAEYEVAEPWTPAAFKTSVCRECAIGQIKGGYTVLPSPEWSFPELTNRENAKITKARLFGYAAFFPCVSGGMNQALRTLAGAKEFLEGRR